MWNFSIVIRKEVKPILDYKMKTPSLKTHRYNYIVETTSPRTVTLIFLLHTLLPPPIVVNAQVNTPSSSVDTLRIVRLTFWGIHLTLTLPLKLSEIPDCPFCKTAATVSLPNCNCNTTNDKSCVRLKFQFSSTLVDPSRSKVLYVRITLLSAVVSPGGGSNQVILPPSKSEHFASLKCHTLMYYFCFYI